MSYALSSCLVPVQKRACQEQAIKQGWVGQGSCQGDEASHAVPHEKEWEVWVLSPHPLAGGQQRSCILLHPLHFCPPTLACPVTNVVVAKAKNTTGRTSLAQTVKIWGDVLSIAVADEHQGSWFSGDRPCVCGQLAVWGGLGSSRKEERQDSEKQAKAAGVHVNTVN